MVISFLLGHSVYHLIQVICFTFLFAKWSLSSEESHTLLSASQKTSYCVWLVLDYLIWSSSRFWSHYITDIALSDPLSSTKFVWSKVLVLAAYSTLLLVPSELKVKTVNHNSVKSKAQANFENRVRIVKVLQNLASLVIRSLYHFVNSPVGIFVQNVLIIIWIFMYPSVMTMLLLLFSTINMVLVSARKIEDSVIISPQRWTQNLLIMYYLSISLILAMSFLSGLLTTCFQQESLNSQNPIIESIISSQEVLLISNTLTGLFTVSCSSWVGSLW